MEASTEVVTSAGLAPAEMRSIRSLTVWPDTKGCSGIRATGGGGGGGGTSVASLLEGRASAAGVLNPISLSSGS